jgi:hypothetical protein
MNSGKLNAELSMTVPVASKMRSLRERVLLWTGPFQKLVYVEPGDLVEERELPWESTRPRSDIFISELPRYSSFKYSISSRPQHSVSPLPWPSRTPLHHLRSSMAAPYLCLLPYSHRLHRSRWLMRFCLFLSSHLMS